MKVEPPASLAVHQTFSMAPKIKQVVNDTEGIRRFVSQCLNVDYQRVKMEIDAKLKAENREMTEKEEDRLEELEIDWGTIPGSKPFLKQPGAEKFLLWLSLRPKYHKQTSELADGHLEMICYCTYLVKGSTEEVFEGPECSCTSMETNFRYIWAEAGYAPEQAEIDRGYQTKMGQWRYIDKWKAGKKIASRVKTWFIRIDNPNIWNERNKVRQQGEKRALVKGVRNMGAISEIFQAGPDEWDMGPETDEPQPDSPDADLDYTKGGRRIYIDGKTPSGRDVQAGSHEAGQAVGKAKLEELKRTSEEHAKTPGTAAHAQDQANKRQVTLDWTKPQDPILTGDLEALVPREKPPYGLLKGLHVNWGSDGFWHVWLDSVKDLRKICVENGYQLTEILPAEKKTSGKQEAKPEKKTSASASGAGAKPAAAGPTLVTGTIHRTVLGTAKNGAPVMNVKIGGIWYTSFVNPLFEYMTNKDGHVIEFWIDKRKQIVGLKRIDDLHFDADGRTPIIQRKDQQAGQRTLY